MQTHPACAGTPAANLALPTLRASSLSSPEASLVRSRTRGAAGNVTTPSVRRGSAPAQRCHVSDPGSGLGDCPKRRRLTPRKPGIRRTWSPESSRLSPSSRCRTNAQVSQKGAPSEPA